MFEDTYQPAQPKSAIILREIQIPKGEPMPKAETPNQRAMLPKGAPQLGQGTILASFAICRPDV